MLKNICFFLIVFIGILAGCNKPARDPDIIYSAYKPILMDADRINTDLFFLPPKDIMNVTKVMAMGDYLLALDYGLGLHVFDVTDKINPVDKGFYQIPACIDFEIEGQKVYANNYNDFIIIDFTDILNPVVIKRNTGKLDIHIKTPDGLNVYEGLKSIPDNTVIISYEKI